MTDKYSEKAEVIRQEQIADGIFSLWLLTEQIAVTAKAGQFLSLYCRDGARLLPRPISICEIDRPGRVLRLVYRVAGNGTAEFSRLQKGDKLRVLGPLGNGFLAKSQNALLVGGGIGVFPLLQLARELTGEKTIVLGFRDKVYLTDEFAKWGKVYLATEDGSSGTICSTRGNVMDVIHQYKLSADTIYACGPTPMLSSVKQFAGEQEIECYLSLEERMACGIGACLACVCQSKEIDPHTNVKNKRICKDGPVFLAQEVEL